MKHKPKKGCKSCKSSRKRKHVKTRRVQRGGVVIGFKDNDGTIIKANVVNGEMVDALPDRELHDGEHYEIMDASVDSANPTLYTGSVRIKILHPPVPQGCAAASGCRRAAPPVISFVLDGYGELVYLSTFNNGKYTKYTGNFQDNKKWGYGVMEESNGSRYEGFWDNDEKIHGKMRYFNGNVYEGDWRNNEANGFGEMLFLGGGYYRGDWVDGVMSGKGEMRLENGDEYRGDFADGNRHGNGIYVAADGDVVHDGTWDNNDPIDED